MAAFSLVRAAMTGAPLPAASVLAFPRRSRVFVTAFAPHHAPIVATGFGESPRDAVVSAGRELAAAMTEELDEAARAHTRLMVEFPVAAGPYRADALERDPGREGVFVRDGGGVAFSAPGEPWTAGLLGREDEPKLDAPALDRLLEDRLGNALAGAARRSFTARSFVESSDLRRPIPLEHGRVPLVDPASIDRPMLRRRIELAAGYLARMVGNDGRFVYMYDASRNREDPEEYNDIRHAGATDALFEAFAELHDPALEVAGERALDRLDRRLAVANGEGEATSLYLPDEENPLGTIGGSGLALIAYCAHYRATKDPAYLPRARGLARFLRGQLDATGRFLPFAKGGVDPSAVYDVMYYYGEAMLGLLRLYELEGDPANLTAAASAARWRLGAPYKKPREKHRDYWYALSLAVLQRTTHEAAFGERARLLAEGTYRELDEDAEAFTSRRFDDTPRVSPTAVALEALAAFRPLATELALAPGPLDDQIRRAASWVLFSQLDEDSAYFARDPAMSLGGFHGDPWTARVRIDDVQHALMALLTWMRTLP